MSSSREISKDVGTELLFENDRVRVWSMELGPGESSPYHHHEYDYVFIYTTPSTIKSNRPGESDTVREFRDGYVQYTEVGAGIEHSITNVSDARHHQIIVELMGPSASSNPLPPENNGRLERSD